MATAEQVRSFVDRILALKEDEDEIKKSIREVYAEAEEREIDKTGIGQVVTHVRKRGKNPSDFDAKEAIFHGYLALYDAGLTHTHAYAREGEITEQPETATENTGLSSSLSGNDGCNTPVAKPMEARHEVAVETSPHTETQIVSGPSGAEPEATCEPSHPHSQPLRKTAADYRAHCLRPDACGASSLDHCFTCKQAMAGAAA